MGKKLKKGKGRLDKYYYLAKEQGFRSRAAFKLVQLNRKYDFLSSASGVLDLCAAPGGWLQVAAKYAPVTTKIVGVDLDSIRPIRNVTSFQCDITTAKCRSELKRIFQNRKIEVVLHDGAPNVGQAWTQDAFTQSQLVLAALKLATEFLKPGGTFVTKVFRSSDYNSLLWVFHQLFHKVEATKPQASRNTSAEIFVVCQGFKDQKIDPKLLDPKYAFKEVEDDASLRVINIFAKKQPKRKPRIGYEDGNILNFKQASVHDFVHTDNPIKLLGTFNALSFEDEQSQEYKKHRKTDAEVITLCEDLRVLNKQDFKKLLKWRTALLADEVKEEEKEEEAPPAELTAEQEEELLEKELSDRISSLTQKEKRVKRKLTKKKQKLAEKLKLKMVLPNDQLDVPEEDALFKLNSIDSGKQLMEVVNDNVTVPETELVDEEDEEQFIEEEDEESDEDSYMNKVEENLNFMYEKYLQRKNKSKPTADLNPENLSDDEDGESNNKRKADVLYKPKISGNVDSDEEVDPDDLEDVDSESEEEHDSESDGEYSKVFSKSAKKPKFKENDNPLLVDPAKPSISKKTAMWFSQPLFQGINLESDDEEAEEQTKQSKANNVDSDSEDENVNEEPSSKKRKEPEPEEAETEIEVVPRQRFLDDLDDEGKVTALALGHMMVNSKRLKQDLIDRSYNRYAFDDSQNAPAWFQEEELKYNKPQIPLTREAIQEVRKKMMALDARPIKKVAEAKARKKIRALRKLSKAKTQAEAIVDNPELNQRQKSQEIEKVFKKANKAVDKKPERVYVVAHKFQKGKVNTSAQRKKGNRVRVVDPRQKKDLKAMKAKAKVKARHAGKKKK